MKKIFFILLSLIILINVNATEVGLAKNSETAILIEATTGKILFEKDKDKKMAPASMTKIMTMLLTMEALESGKISLDEDVLISENAQKMGGTQIYVEAGSNVKVEDLIKGIGIASANDVVVTKKQSQVIGEEITI
ncbi:MAG: serine hydrolase [Mollicutes bacterium]|nr:serine hydrolase [Mollicutes bacterium]